jgi:hypothetical protein
MGRHHSTFPSPSAKMLVCFAAAHFVVFGREKRKKMAVRRTVGVRCKGDLFFPPSLPPPVFPLRPYAPVYAFWLCTAHCNALPPLVALVCVWWGRLRGPLPRSPPSTSPCSAPPLRASSAHPPARPQRSWRRVGWTRPHARCVHAPTLPPRACDALRWGWAGKSGCLTSDVSIRLPSRVPCPPHQSTPFGSWPFMGTACNPYSVSVLILPVRLGPLVQSAALPPTPSFPRPFLFAPPTPHPLPPPSFASRAASTPRQPHSAVVLGGVRNHVEPGPGDAGARSAGALGGSSGGRQSGGWLAPFRPHLTLSPFRHTPVEAHSTGSTTATISTHTRTPNDKPLIPCLVCVGTALGAGCSLLSRSGRSTTRCSLQPPA